MPENSTLPPASWRTAQDDPMRGLDDGLRAYLTSKGVLLLLLLRRRRGGHEGGARGGRAAGEDGGRRGAARAVGASWDDEVRALRGDNILDKGGR
ncbi:hypothetical protein MY11210_005814 [Beauveria gryllotalpidicola]